jgi:serine/threonine protein kinase
MATVYRAYDPLFEREVALKVLPPQLLHDPTFQARFAREAKTIATLEHTGIVPVYDFGEQDGQPFYVMRLMTGGSLAERLAYGPMSVEETVRVVSQVADALDEAHAHGVVHRDLKPGNIMFDQRGNAFLSDFGIAKVVHASTPLTSSSMLIGTPAYMSPEQGRGERDIDGRSDVYALGALLFQMLSGRVPYESETPTGQIIKHITDPIPNVLSLRKELPAGIQTVIERAMAKKKEARYATASEMAAALRRAAEGGQVTPAPQVKPTEERTVIVTEEEMPERGTGSYPTKKRKLSGWIWVGGALGLLTLLGIIFL